MRAVHSQNPYRPEIDGLRAIAVLSVILSHAHLGLPGGFIGVDVFFVISGYLITCLIVEGLEQRTFSLGEFWARRCRRIVPAMVAVLLTALLAGWFLLLPSDFAALGKAVSSQAVLVANFYYWRTLGYFWPSATEVPLLHTWSLAVEEQFYLITPVLLISLFRVTKHHQRTNLLGVAGIGMAVSLAFSEWLLRRHPEAAFYLLPSRAWELLLGTMLAVLPRRWLPQWRGMRELASWIGLASIVVPCFCYTAETPFPGFAAVPPCLGAALFIWANARDSERKAPTTPGDLLSRRAPVFIGLISYSLYLWHWPLLAFSNYWSLSDLSLGYRVSIVGIVAILAYASWRWVETPFRRRRGSRPTVLALAGGALAIVLVAGAAVIAGQGFPSRFSKVTLRYAAAKSEATLVHEMSPEEVFAGNLLAIGTPTSTSSVRLVVWGDSHAMAAMPAFDSLLRQNGLAGRAAIHSSTVPVLDYLRKPFDQTAHEAVRFNEAVFSYITARRVPDVALVACWDCYVDITNPADAVRLESALVATIRRLNGIGVRTWILAQVPAQPFDVPKALIRASLTHENLSNRCAKPATRRNMLEGIHHDLLGRIAAAGGNLIDPCPHFLDDTQTYYRIVLDGAPMYRDTNHLTVAAAQTILLPVLRAAGIAGK